MWCPRDRPRGVHRALKDSLGGTCRSTHQPSILDSDRAPPQVFGRSRRHDGRTRLSPFRFLTITITMKRTRPGATCGGVISRSAHGRCPLVTLHSGVCVLDGLTAARPATAALSTSSPNAQVYAPLTALSLGMVALRTRVSRASQPTQWHIRNRHRPQTREAISATHPHSTPDCTRAGRRRESAGFSPSTRASARHGASASHAD